MPSRKRIAFTGDRNRAGKKDYTFAFRPEAIMYAGADRVFAIDMSWQPRVRRDLIATAIGREAPTEVGFFCHGLSKKIELGFDVSTAHELASILYEVGCTRVALHACLTGKDPINGFAATLRDQLWQRFGDGPVRVLGSTTSGHTSRNPHRRLFRSVSGMPGTAGFIVEPGSALWKPWVKRMHAPNDPLRFELLEREPEAIREELENG